MLEGESPYVPASEGVANMSERIFSHLWVYACGCSCVTAPACEVNLFSFLQDLLCSRDLEEGPQAAPIVTRARVFVGCTTHLLYN